MTRMACGREGRGQVAAVGGLQLQAAWRPSVVGVRSSAKRLQRGAPPRPSRARGGPPASKSGPPASLFFPSQNGPPRRANGGRHRRAILPLHPAGCSLHEPTGPRRSGQGIPSPPLTQQPSTSGATGGEGGVGRGGVVARAPSFRRHPPHVTPRSRQRAAAMHKLVGTPPPPDGRRRLCGKAHAAVERLQRHAWETDPPHGRPP